MSTSTCHTWRIRKSAIMSAYISFFMGMCALTSCHRNDDPVQATETYPIELAASTGTSKPVKGPVSTVGDMLDKGFVVWASWTKDPDDEAIFTNDYSTGFTNLVFGRNGTKVYADDTDGDGNFTPQMPSSGDVWYYTPKRFWYRGTYTFAAASPASVFNVSHARTDAEKTGNTITGSIADDPDEALASMTLNLTGSGLALGGLKQADGTRLDDSAQADLMYAFTDVDNKDENAGTVGLNFSHTCSLLGIKLTSDSPKTLTVKNIRIYGIHNAAAGTLDLISEDIEGNTDRLRALLTDPATENNYFAEFRRPEGEAAAEWDVVGGSEAVPVQLVENLIVFPETLSAANSLKVKITYNDGADSDKYLNASLSAGSWEAGKVYVYTLSADAMEFTGEPEVTPWEDGERTEIDIE